MVRSPTSIMVTDTSSSGVTVQWMFLEPFNVTQKETCVVMYGTTSGSQDSSTAVTVDGHQTYSVSLNLLATATDYSYVIRCWNKFNNVGISSAKKSFRTSDRGELRFILFIIDNLILYRVWACERISYNIF